MTSEAQEGIRRTIMQYAQLCDDGRFTEWADLFTSDTRFHVMGSTQSGRDTARAWIEKAQGPDARGRHAVFTPVINVGGDGRTAWAWTDYLFFDKAGTVTSTGRYHDELVQGPDGRWRFSLREIVFQGGEPELAGQPPGG